MPITDDPQTGEQSDFASGIDVHSAVAGEPSLWEEASDFVTKAVPLTGLAIVNSFANTGVAVDNFFGGDAQKLTVQDEVGDGDLNDYYNQHQQGIEAAGLVVGSLIPGMVGVKALKLAQAGNFGETIARATSLFAGPKAALLNNAKSEILAGDQGLLASLKSDSYKAIALGFGENALEGLAFTAASTAAQQGSPLLNQQGLGDAVSDIAMGSLVGGAVGGVFSGIRTAWLFKKAALGADTLTKSADFVTRYGSDLGNVLAGDRALGILQAVDKLPVQETSLGQTKLAANSTASVMDAKIAMQSLVDDPEVASSFIDALQTAKASGATTEDLYSKLNRLAKITRITDETTPAEAADSFFINRFAKNAGADFSQLMSKTPDPSAVFSQRFAFTGPDAPSIARAADVGSLADGSTFPLFANSAEAFEEGHDIFINKNMQVIINPQSSAVKQLAREGESRKLSQAEEKLYRETGQLPSGAKPLLGGSPLYGQAFEAGPSGVNVNKPMIFNLKTGNLSEGASAVVGDYGQVSLQAQGLKYGDQFSKQSLTEGLINATTPTIDANARYTWAALRGIKTGDVIQFSDTPMLQQLYKEVTKAGGDIDAFMKQKKLAFADGVAPADTTDLLNTIRNQKNALLTDVISGQPKLGADEAALRAGVPSDYIADGLKATEPEKLLADTDSYQQTQHVKLWYDIGNIHQQDGQILKGAVDHQYRIDLIDNTVKAQLAKYVGGQDWDRFLISGASSDATPQGAKAGFISSSQSAYGSLGQEAERVGRSVAKWLEDRSGVINGALAAPIGALRDDAAATAELAMFTAVRQRTNQVFKWLPDQLKSQFFPDAAPDAKIAVLRDSVQMDAKTGVPVWDRSYLPAGFVDGAGSASGAKGNFNYYSISSKVAAFEDATKQLNGERVQARNQLRTAQGLRLTQADPDALYAPPIDTSKYRYFALVKQATGLGGADDSAGMIVAQDAASLQQKISALGSDFSVWTKDLLAKNHQVLGDYDGGRNFVDNKVNSEMAKRGVLSDIFPDTRLDTLIQRHVDWHSASESSLIRDHVETGNGQLFAELQAMGDRYTASQASTFGKAAAGPLDSAPNDPYRSYINTALNLRPRDSYRAWYAANEKLEAYFDTAFNTARNYFKAGQKGLVPFETAVQAAKKFGLGDVYGDGVDALKNYSDLTNKLPPQRFLSNWLSKASSAMNYTVIRLDAWQQLVHALSTPILIASELHSANDAVKSLLTTELPGEAGAATGQMIPATSKLMYQAASNLFNSDVVDKYLPLYKAAGAIRNPEQELIHRAMREELQLPFGSNWKTPEQLATSGSKILAAASKLSNWTEFATSWTAADSARQLFEAKGFTGRELSDNIASFVNRVKGNMVASQRPVAFQGPIGQAIGLFQSYQFNLMQNVFRYVGENEGKSLAIATGLQSSLFGLGSLPGVGLLNSAIIGNAAGNTSHADIFSTLPSYFGKRISDYLMYGVASNVLNASLFTRGDMNPRNLTLLPVNPLNFPAIAGGIRVYQALAGTAEKIAAGGDASSSILLGLEHNGLSRPLGGLAQLAQGFSTTASGKLISAAWPQQTDPLGGNTSGLVDLFNAGVFSRLLGARPLDDAIALEAEYRNTAYRAKDTARLEALGAAVKSSMYQNQLPSSDQISSFASHYAASGGNINGFGRKMLEWSTQANSSIANAAFRDLRRPLNQQMMQAMGGRPLMDFRGGSSTPSEQEQ